MPLARAAVLAAILLPAGVGCPSASFGDNDEETDGASDQGQVDVPAFLDGDTTPGDGEGDGIGDGVGDDSDAPCTIDSCDDGNPCTDDVCQPTGCVFTPNGADCFDGLFCNGTDTCRDGFCIVHSGDPCPGASVCTEELSTCDGCLSNDDCPDSVEGPWSTCDFVNSCASAGTERRTVQTFTCQTGTCVAEEQNESRACSRPSRDGTSCGATSCGDFGACDFSGFCDESAQQTRSCTDQVCQGGLCSPSVRTESMPCSRSRSGQSCNPQTCDNWGACDWSGDCDESAQRSRTCYNHVCGGGSCNASPFNVTESCTRDTDGDGCGSNPSYCGQTTDCRRCSAGNCVVNTPHYNASCSPSCGEAARLCGSSGHMCCGVGVNCATAGPGPWADCGQCCAQSFCQ